MSSSTDSVTFRTFDLILRELGFRGGRTSEGFRVYVHDPTDTVVTLPRGADDDRLPSYHVSANRYILDWRGVTTEQHYDELLRTYQAA